MKLIDIEASIEKPKYVTFGTEKTNLKWDGRWLYKLHSVFEDIILGTLDKKDIEILLNTNEFVDYGKFYWAKENLSLEQVYSDKWSESKMEDENDYHCNESCCTLQTELCKKQAKEVDQAMMSLSISEQIKELESEKLKIDSKLINLKKASKKEAFENCRAKYTEFLKTLTTEENKQLEEVIYRVGYNPDSLHALLKY
jgi:hypothetical protein